MVTERPKADKQEITELKIQMTKLSEDLRAKLTDMKILESETKDGVDKTTTKAGDHKDSNDLDIFTETQLID